ncbi:MAG: HesB/IscA family protein [Planctomycetota bacterium]|jgi:iron-sulfur cluster assembly accessory protein
MSTTPTPTISIDDLAVSHVQEVIANDPSLIGKALRLSVQEVGCEGMSYVFSYDDVNEADVTTTYKGTTLAVGPEAIEYVSGCIVTFGEMNNEEPSLKVANPNATSSCVCGQSFNVEDGPAKPEPADTEAAASN